MLSCTFHCWDWSVDSRSDGTVIQSQPCSIMPQLQQNNCWKESGRFRRVYSRISVSFSSVGVWLSNRPRHRTQWTPAVNTGLRAQHQRNSQTLNRQRAGSASAVLSLISDYIYAHTVCCASKQWYSVVRKVENVYVYLCRYKYANKLLFYTQFMTHYILIMHSLQEDVTWAYGEPQH